MGGAKIAPRPHVPDDSAIKAVIKDAKPKAATLRSFGCVLSVKLMYHAAADGLPTAMMVETKDEMRFNELQKWAAICIWGEAKDEMKRLCFSWVHAVTGASTPLATTDDAMKWMDTMWSYHPLELHVYLDATVAAAKRASATNYAEQLFKQLDRDGSGKLDALEMLMAQELLVLRNVEDEDMQEQVHGFVERALKAADADGSVDVTKEEFLAAFGQLSESVTTALLHADGFSQSALMVNALQAKSKRLTLTEALAQTLTLDVDPATNFGIVVELSAGCVTDATKDVIIQAKTIHEDLVDMSMATNDSEHALGTLASPLVYIELSGGLKALPDQYTVMLPHIFSETPSDSFGGLSDSGLSKPDVVVAQCDPLESEWSVIDADDYELVTATDNDGLAAIKVKLSKCGIVGVFAKTDRPFAERVICLCFAPAKINVLEPDTLRIYLTSDTPEKLANVFLEEMTDRGLSLLCGCSTPLRVLNNQSQVRVIVTDAAGEPTKFESWWDGATQKFDLELHPDAWEHLVDGASPTYGIAFESTSLFNRRRLPRKPDARVAFDATLALQTFPPPSAPTALRAVSCTQSNLGVDWQPPDDWGGCAIDKYQLEMRLKSAGGALGEWNQVLETSGWDTEEGIGASVYACELRIRAFNVACKTPSPWSEVVTLEHDALEALSAGGPAISHKPKFGAKVEGANRGGVAVVGSDFADNEGTVEGTEAFGANKKGPPAFAIKQFVGDTAGMEGWSPFRQAIGAYFIRAGVRGGASGKLFDLSAAQVEALVSSQAMSDTRSIGKDEPLVGLAYAGVWVMQTLAHHSEHAYDLVTLLNRLSGLLEFVAVGAVGVLAGGGEAVSSLPQMEALLAALIRIYETMGQTDRGGYVHEQLTHRYSRKVRERLKSEWEATLDHLAAGVVEQALDLAAKTSLEKKLALEAKQLGSALASAELMGALSFKVAQHKRAVAA